MGGRRRKNLAGAMVTRRQNGLKRGLHLEKVVSLRRLKTQGQRANVGVCIWDMGS